MGLFDKLKETEERFDALGRELEDPAIMSNGQAIARISKERGALERLVTTYRRWKDAVRQREDAELLLEEDDPDMQAEAKQEIARLSALEDELEEKLKSLLVAADEDSHRDAIVEIRGGTGGDEASLFAADLFRMYSKYAERRGWKVEVQGKHETDVGGFKDITFMMRGDGVYAVMAYESGGHRVQRVPKTESQGRIHTSAATVAVLPQVDAVEVAIDPNDLKIDLYSAGGPGGQHVNKTQSAVRITHLPSGIVVQCQDERSQHKNKDRAMSHLRSRLYDHIRAERDRARGTLRKTLIGSGDRSDRIRTYNYPQNRVTDHRINVSIHSLEQFLEGDMEPLIEKLQEHDKEQRLAALGGE